MTESSFYDPLVLTNLLCHEFIAAGVSQLAASQGSASSLDIYCPVYCSTATRAYLAQQSVGASIMIRENPPLDPERNLEVFVSILELGKTMNIIQKYDIYIYTYIYNIYIYIHIYNII